MNFEFRYSSHSGKWQSVEVILPSAGAPTVQRVELGSGRIASGLEVAVAHGINHQNVYLYDKQGHVYSTKMAADLKDLVPYPFQPTPGDQPKVYDIIAPFFVLKTSQSFVHQYGDPTLGPSRTNYLLGYQKTGAVDIIELPSRTVTPYHTFIPGVKKIEALSLLGKNGAGKDQPMVYFLAYSDTKVMVYPFTNDAEAIALAVTHPPLSVNIASNFESATSVVLVNNNLRVFNPKDYQSVGYFLLSSGGQVDILRVDASSHEVRPTSCKLFKSSFNLVGSFTPRDKAKQTFLSVDHDGSTHVFRVQPTHDTLIFSEEANAPTGFPEQQVTAIHITKYIDANTGIRNQIVRGLIEASELEHILMLQYIYAAMSLKTRVDEFTHPQRKYRQFELVRLWKKQIMAIASEEMRHLAYVQGLLISVSGASHLLRAELPDAHSYFPPGNTLMALQRFNATTLARFIKFERPDNAEDVDQHYKDIRAAVGTKFQLLFDDDVRDAEKWMPNDNTARTAAVNAVDTTPITPDDPEYTTIGQLYKSLKDLIRDDLLISTNEPLLNVSYVALLRRTMEARNLNLFFPSTAENFKHIIDQIVKEGEGFEQSDDPEPGVRPHYERFLHIMKEFAEEKRADPDFDPARPVISNPALFKSRQVNFSAASSPAELFNPTFQAVIRKNNTSAQLLANHTISAKLVDLINVADISEGAHLISIGKTAHYVQIERFYSMEKLALEIVGLMEDNKTIPPHVVTGLRYVADSFRLTANEFEYRAVYPKWPALLYVEHDQMDPLANHVKQELSEYCEFVNVTGKPGEKPALVDAKLKEFETTKFNGLKLSFSGWTNVRLGTDPDWSDHRTGASGNSYAYCDELERNPPVILDRVLRFNLSEEERSRYQRSNGQHVGVTVHEAVKIAGGRSEPVESLKGALVNLEKYKDQGAVYVGRNYLVAYDGEPIHPFILSVSSPTTAAPAQSAAASQSTASPSTNQFHLQRSVKVKSKGAEESVSLEKMSSFERSLLGRWPYDISVQSDEKLIAEVGDLFPKNDSGEKIKSAVEYIKYKVAKLEDQLSKLTKFTAEYEAVNFRLHDIKTHMYANGSPVVSGNIKWMRYKFYCNYCHHVTGPIAGNLPSALGLEVDDQSRWIVKYDAFLYDSDSLNHFIRGEIYIPTKK